MKPDANIPLAKHTTFKIGGPARYFLRVKSLEELKEAIGFARLKNLPFYVIGEGSNILADDGGFRGVIIKNELKGLSFVERGNDVEVEAMAGESWDGLVEAAVSRGLYGIENLSGIPGTVGAAPVQNIGAYGIEIEEVLITLKALDSRSGETKIFGNADCSFGYRSSFFKSAEGRNYIVLLVKMRLRKSAPLNLAYKDLKNYFAEGKVPPTLLDVREAVLEIRKGKFPDLKTTGTAGSFFKNPVVSEAKFNELKKKFSDLPGFPMGDDGVKIPLAWVIDKVLKMKGCTLGKVALYERQPIVFIAQAGASSREILELAEQVALKVAEATGIEIAWEVEKV